MNTIRTNTPAQIAAKIQVSKTINYLDSLNYQEVTSKYNDYVHFSRLRLKNPTMMDIAYREEFAKKILRYPEKYEENLELMNNNSLVKYIQSLIDSKLDRDFYTTKRLRKILINNDRFSLDCVKPKLESKFQKLIIKLKSII